MVLDDSFIHFASVDVDGYTGVKNDKSSYCVTIYEAMTEMERTSDGGSPSLNPNFCSFGNGVSGFTMEKSIFFLFSWRT